MDHIQPHPLVGLLFFFFAKICCDLSKKHHQKSENHISSNQSGEYQLSMQSRIKVQTPPRYGINSLNFNHEFSQYFQKKVCFHFRWRFQRIKCPLSLHIFVSTSFLPRICVDFISPIPSVSGGNISVKSRNTNAFSKCHLQEDAQFAHNE